MSRRVPSLQDVAQLDREEWENLCAGISILDYDATRVEDHFGKGNGLDTFHLADGKVRGWQFKRLNERLGGPQIDVLKKAIARARKYCELELSAVLSKFTLIVNIDPQPGHGGVTGEIERLKQLADWAKSEHGVEFDFKGLTFVHTRLLKSPGLYPELFEDVIGAIEESNRVMQAGFDSIHEKLRTLQPDPGIATQLESALKTLVTEAEIHYSRGKDAESEQEYLRAIRNLDDAKRLIENHPGQRQFYGRILALVSGIKALIGDLPGALKDGRDALSILSDTDCGPDRSHAKGNYAIALVQSQRFDEAEPLLREILLEFEKSGNQKDLILTAQHLVEIHIHRGSITSNRSGG